MRPPLQATIYAMIVPPVSQKLKRKLFIHSIERWPVVATYTPANGTPITGYVRFSQPSLERSMALEGNIGKAVAFEARIALPLGYPQPQPQLDEVTVTLTGLNQEQQNAAGPYVGVYRVEKVQPDIGIGCFLLSLSKHNT